MNPDKRQLHSLLSIFLVIIWFVSVALVLYRIKDEWWLVAVIATYLATIAGGIIGGITLILAGALRNRQIKKSFVYNLFGTLNIMIGFIGMALLSHPVNNSPSAISASFAIGLLIYCDIYRAKRSVS